MLTALFCAVWAYMSLRATGLERTALCFVGLPASLAMVVGILVPQRRAVLTTAVAVTCGLAVAGPVFNESAASLLLVAPLAYVVALAVALCSGTPRGRVLVVVALLGLCAEGVVASLPRDGSVTVTRVVRVAPEEMHRVLAGAPEFSARPPLFLRLGFPLPRQVTVDGASGALAVGDERVVSFTSRMPLGIGVQPEPRVLRLRVTEREERRVVFQVVRDTALHRWVRLRYTEVSWRASAAGHSEVEWKLGYRRTFDPAWYFGPLQGYGAERAADYLADAFRP
ncbi:hypothetical protein GCM10027168_28770 [Streptomyces capparidis]